jgi:hypothetical protein
VLSAAGGWLRSPWLEVAATPATSAHVRRWWGAAGNYYVFLRRNLRPGGVSTYGCARVTVSGDAGQLRDLLSLSDTFEFWFNIVTPVDMPNQ